MKALLAWRGVANVNSGINHTLIFKPWAEACGEEKVIAIVLIWDLITHMCVQSMSSQKRGMNNVVLHTNLGINQRAILVQA